MREHSMIEGPKSINRLLHDPARATFSGVSGEVKPKLFVAPCCPGKGQYDGFLRHDGCARVVSLHRGGGSQIAAAC